MSMSVTLAAIVQTVTSDDRLIISVPTSPQGLPGFSAKTDIQIVIGLSSASQYGYQPIEFTARLQRPAASGRQVRIRFHVGSWNNRGRAMWLDQALTIEKGKIEATAQTLIPQYQDWQLCGWETTVDGEPDEQLSPDDVMCSQQQAGFGVSALMASRGGSPWPLQATLQLVGNGVNSLRVRNPSALPTTWIGYSTIDVVVFPADELPRFASSRPRQFTALARWVRAGGNLWIVSVGPRWQKLPAVESALGHRTSATGGASASDADEADSAIIRRGWRFVPLGDRAMEPLEGALLLSGYDVGEAEAKAPTAALPLANQLGGGPVNSPTTSKEHFAVRAFGLGTVTAFRHATLGSSFEPETVAAIQQSLLGARLMSVSRHGNKPDEANADFNNWLIPGVGVAPIGQFQILISLFVLAIGPLNYWWLKRRGKLPLLLATAPAAAVLVTLALMSYGVLGDGLGVRVRARSFTLLDQTSGESTTWGRVSYYAGINPRRGLSMPSDAVVYPIPSPWSMGRYGQGASLERTIAWTDAQELSRGWLPSRTTTQYLAINARASKKRLDLQLVKGEMQVDNRLGAAVTHLVVQDRKGQLFWLEALPAGARGLAKHADPLKLSGSIRQLFSDNYPEFPPGAETSSYGGYPDIVLSRGMLEAQIEAINSPIVQRWTNGSYIAVTDRAIELEFGVDDVSEEASFHVLRGLW